MNDAEFMENTCGQIPVLIALRLRRSQNGFTLIELIMVIVMLGVLAVFAAPRIFNTGDFSARGFHDETMSLLRYAQKTAIAQRRTVCVALNDTGVTLSIDTNTPPDGVCDIALVPPNTARGGRGLLGAPPAFAYTALGSTDKTAAISITIPNASNITVEADTGYVHD
jgi:MSHA pilin protein MshC